MGKVPTIKRYVFFPDTQIPFHNPRQVRALINYIGSSQPDSVIIIGDWMDYPTPSRWSQGTREEFTGSVQRDSGIGRKLLAELRSGYSGPVHFLEGNHDARPRTYLRDRAPALAESDAFDIENLLDFDGHGITKAPDWFEFAPGWVATHGHLGLSLSRQAGYTALNGARAIGKSLVIGHVHRLGIGSYTAGYDGRTSTLYGIEVGHMMDVRKAGYLKRGAANWQSGFAMLDTDGKTSTPTLVPMRPDGSFIADGRKWG
ncbi:hypothetical protein GCM10010466_29620 [Planomonospora alba]|uniref:Calcineurin-like phosphoesterase domain-containing protein n=2 Tax=Planomonospora alba TaxID=161354 RepID=A0ABP6N564_9ACTN